MFKPTHEDNKLGEICYLDFEMVLRLMLEANTLTEIACSYSVEILFTLDFGIGNILEHVEMLTRAHAKKVSSYMLRRTKMVKPG